MEKKEAQKKLEEEVKVKRREEMLKYYDEMELVKVLGASIMQGKAVRPAIFCGVLEGPSTVDLHFKFCKYR